MDLILPLTTLILIVAGLAMQIMTRNAWQSAIAAVEDRIDTVEKRAIAEAQARLDVAARVSNTEAALAELERREETRRAEPSASDLAKTIGLIAKRTPKKPEGK